MHEPSFRIEMTRRSIKDIEHFDPKLKKKLADILRNRIAQDPLSGKKLVGDLSGYWSVRLSLRDRIVYRIDKERHIVYVLRARTHYEKL